MLTTLIIAIWVASGSAAVATLGIINLEGI